MQDGQRLRRNTDGQVGFLVVDPETKKRAVRLDRGTKLGTDQSLVPYAETIWEEDELPRLNPEQLRRICYAADRELRIVRGEYSVPEWKAMHERDRVGWQMPKDADVARKRVMEAIKEALAGE